MGNAFLVKTASLLRGRDGRRIEGDYIFTAQDWLERKTFEDEIGRNCYYIDVHKIDVQFLRKRLREEGVFLY